MSNDSQSKRYIHGHDENVLRSHTWRNIDNCASFLKPHLKRSTRVLDCGCGPGTITADFANYCDNVVGIDQAPLIIQHASETFPNITFLTADVTNLPFEDNSFDIVFAHILLVYVSDLSSALKEMHRVCAVDGYVAIRESEVTTHLIAPYTFGFSLYCSVYNKGLQLTQGHPHIVTDLPGHLRKVGFNEYVISTSSWIFSSLDDRKWWGSLWIARLTHGNMIDTWKTNGIVNDDQLRLMIESFQSLQTDENAFYILPCVEFLCRKSI